MNKNCRARFRRNSELAGLITLTAKYILKKCNEDCFGGIGNKEAKITVFQ